MSYDPEDLPDDGAPPQDPPVDQEEDRPDPDSLLDEADRSAMRRIEELRRREEHDPGSLMWKQGNPG